MKLIRPFKPDKSNNPQKALLKFVRSSNKYSTIWQYLKRYQSKDYVASQMSSKFPTLPSEVVDIKSRHIAESIRQSEAYFNTALVSDLSIRPLIIYYGMLDLVKALIMYGDNILDLGSHEMSLHGLSFRSKLPVNISIRKDPNNLLEEYSYAQKTIGIFHLLHACWSQKDLNEKMRFELKELISIHPDSWKTITDHTGIIPKLFLANGGFRHTTQPEHIISFSSVTQFLLYQKPPDEDPDCFFERVFPTLKTHYRREGQSTSFSYVDKTIPLTIDEMIPVYRSIAGDRYAITDIDTGAGMLSLSPIEVEFIIMFILGSLARYAPQKWLRNVRYEGSEEMFMLEGIIDSSILSFPKMILEQLDEAEYTFTGDTSYYT